MMRFLATLTFLCICTSAGNAQIGVGTRPTLPFPQTLTMQPVPPLPTHNLLVLPGNIQRMPPIGQTTFHTFGGIQPFFPAFFYDPRPVVVNNYVTLPEPRLPPPTGLSKPAPVSILGKARLTISIPPGAELWFQGKKVERPGTTFVFESPDLHEQETHVFEVRVFWREGGEPVEMRRSLTVVAGETKSLTYFGRPDRE